MSTSIASRIHLPEPFPETLYLSRVQVLAWLEDLISRFEIDQIYLFGSVANGTATQESDLDVLTLVPHEGSHREMAYRMELATYRGLSVDLIVRTPNEAAEALANSASSDWFLRKILMNGTRIYDAGSR